MACTLPAESRRLATKILAELSEESKEILGLKASSSKEDEDIVVGFIARLIRQKVNALNDDDEQTKALNTLDTYKFESENGLTFLEYLEKNVLRREVSDEEYEKELKEYNENIQRLGGTLPVKVGVDKKIVNNRDLKIPIAKGAIIVTLNKENKDDRTVDLLIRKPVKGGKRTLSPRERAIDRLKKISALSTKSNKIQIINKQGDKEWVTWSKYNELVAKYGEEVIIPTGLREFMYFVDGAWRTIQATSVTFEKPDPTEHYPVAASPIGTGTDAAGREILAKGRKFLANAKSSKYKIFDDEGNLIADTEENNKIIQKAIDEEFFGLFTVQGFRNLAKDFEEVRKELTEKFGEGEELTFITDQFNMFARRQENGKDVWTVGSVDALAVNKNGLIIVLDFKTNKITNVAGYTNIFDIQYKNKPKLGDKYGTQLADYVQMLKSWDLNVYDQPYIIQVDTWYISEDRGLSPENKVYDADRYHINVFGKSIDSGEYTMGQHASKHPMSREGMVITEDGQIKVLSSKNEEERVIYIEPRLHVVLDKENKKFTPELAALLPTPYKEVKPFKQQVQALNEAERRLYDSFVSGEPASESRPLPHGIRGYNKESIDSNPELMMPDEIQAYAENFMYSVYMFIERIKNGEETWENNKSLKGLSHEEIIDIVGIDNIINARFEEAYEKKEIEEFDEKKHKTREKYEKKCLKIRRKNWIANHKEEFLLKGRNYLMGLEDTVVPRHMLKQDSKKEEEEEEQYDDWGEETETGKTQDLGDVDQLQSVVDSYNEGVSYMEAWVMGQRHFSPKASLAKEIRKLFNLLYKTDENGYPEKDNLGNLIPIDSTKAVQAVMDICYGCESYKEMESKLKTVSETEGNTWIKQLLNLIDETDDKEENIRKKFFRHFRKDQLWYSVAEPTVIDGQRVVRTRIVNLKSAFETMRDSLGHEYEQGEVGSIIKNGQLSRRKILEASEHITSLQKLIAGIYNSWGILNAREKEALKEKDIKNKKEYVAAEFKKRQVIREVQKCLAEIGVLIPSSALAITCGDPENTIVLPMLKNANQVLKALRDMYEDGVRQFNSLAGNKAYYFYKEMLIALSKGVQESVESSFYINGKSYYSYTNPSKLLHTIMNMKDALNSLETSDSRDNSKFMRYMYENFGRYEGWFKQGKTWLNDLLGQLNDTSNKGEVARRTLMHKVEIAYNGKEYKNMGSLAFQLSILHNFFPSDDDLRESEENPCGWFAMPTMSNKPTNEFLRMLLYRGPKADPLRDNKIYSDDIVEKVLMPTFQQECNRIADVLYNYVHNPVATDQFDLTDKEFEKAGYVVKKDGKIIKDERPELKKRIEEKKITITDLEKLSRTKSGAKFHFLWYLNDAIKKNNELGERVATRINNLLTKNKDQKLNDNYEVKTDELIKNTIIDNMIDIVEAELKEMEKIGLFEIEIDPVDKTQHIKYQREFEGKLGKEDPNNIKVSKERMQAALRNFIWQDIAANINIIQITGGDLAYFGNSINYQKRIAQEHSPGIHMMSDPRYDDGFLRSVHISDEIIKSDLVAHVTLALEQYMEKNIPVEHRKEYQTMIDSIVSMMDEINVTDGQSYDCMTSFSKKLRAQGVWTLELEAAFKKVMEGDFELNNLNIIMQPTKPFVAADVAKFSGSPSMRLRKTPLQDKNSEYLILLAGAFARQAKKRNKMAAIYDFMEKSAERNPKQGIDTVHFHSVGKVGVSGTINLQTFDKNYDKIYNKAVEEKWDEVLDKKGEILDEDEAYTALLTSYMLEHIERTTDNCKIMQVTNEDFEQYKSKMDYIFKQEDTIKELLPNEKIYNSRFVDTIPMERYVFQQEVPAHFFDEKGQLYGSQMRILGISDITPGEKFYIRKRDPKTGKEVVVETLEDSTLVEEYKRLHAENIGRAFRELMEKLGLDLLSEDNNITFKKLKELPIGDKRRDTIFEKLATMLQDNLAEDMNFSSELTKACQLVRDSNGHVIDFRVPLLDPTHSTKIQMLLHSIIKKAINKERINGGPLVQVTAFDHNLNIVFRSEDGTELTTFTEWKSKHPEYSEEEAIAQFKKLLKDEKYSIAKFQVYASVPNEKMRMLITRPDGSLMTPKEIEKEMPELWEKMSKMIGFRIPTEDKYSMIPMEIVGFTPEASGQVVVMPREITFLTNSDFDIDKMYVMIQAWITSALSKKDEKVPENTIKQILDTLTTKEQKQDKEFMNAARRAVINADAILKGEKKRLHDGINPASIDKNFEKFLDDLRVAILKERFEVAKDMGSKSERKAKKARDNRLFELQWAVLTSSDTLAKILNPGNFDEFEKVGYIIDIRQNEIKKPGTDRLWTEEELNSKTLQELDEIAGSVNPHNTTLPSSKIYYQRQNMQGAQMVGIFANNNVSHAFCSFQKIGIDLQKGQDRSFILDRHTIGSKSDMVVLDEIKGWNGMLVSKIIARALEASVDTAKKPCLTKSNVNTFTGGVAMLLARLGYDEKIIGYLLAQPVVKLVSEIFFKNNIENYYDGNVAIRSVAKMLGIEGKKLDDFGNFQVSAGMVPGKQGQYFTREELFKHLTDKINKVSEEEDKYSTNEFQKDVLRLFNTLFKMAKDLQDLTFCTKFNSVKNAGGPTIADTEILRQKVEDFKRDINKTCFYVPSGNSTFTNPAQVIENDDLLKAFYNFTISDYGAIQRIFENFFPHYLPGFKDVLDYFKKNYCRKGKLTREVYNQLINDYVYFLLTMKVEKEKEEENILPVIPTDEVDLDYLTKTLPKTLRELLDSKDRRENMLLDKELGSNGLSVRDKGRYINYDTIEFRSGQLNTEVQDKLRTAWDALLMDNNPRVARFGIDLFFYTLLRNGFNFSPKTLMHLSTVLARLNATFGDEGIFSNYLVGLRNIENLDAEVAGFLADTGYVKRFCKQFARNRAHNSSLVPFVTNANILSFVKDRPDMIVISTERDGNENSKLYSIKMQKGVAQIITAFDQNRQRQVYELVKSEEFDTEVVYTYKKTSRLGVRNNFIEYNANNDIEESYYKDWKVAESDEEDISNTDTTTPSDDGDGNIHGEDNEDAQVNMWMGILIPILTKHGVKTIKDRVSIRNAILSSIGSGSINVTTLLDKLSGIFNNLSQETIDEIKNTLEEQNPCGKV